MKNHTKHANTEKLINASLAAMPAEKRPVTSFRTRIQSVAYQARGFYEATDGNGSTEPIARHIAEGWIQ